jgi:putative membrane protein
MKLLTILRAASLVILFFVACQPSKKQEDGTEIAKELNDETFEDTDDKDDADFIVNAITANFAEIKLAQLASNKSTDILVTNLAKMLETDHTKVLQELQAYATQKGIAAPTTETNEAAADLAALAQEDSKDFDKKWCDKLKASHKKSIRKFESRINKTEDTELRNLISAVLPSLKIHLDMIEKEYDRLK